MHYQDLIILAQTIARYKNRAPATVSNWIVGHARLFSRLEAGQGTTVATYNRAAQWFSDHWPDDLAWPANIARPRKSEEAA